MSVGDVRVENHDPQFKAKAMSEKPKRMNYEEFVAFYWKNNPNLDPSADHWESYFHAHDSLIDSLEAENLRFKDREKVCYELHIKPLSYRSCMCNHYIEMIGNLDATIKMHEKSALKAGKQICELAERVMDRDERIEKLKKALKSIATGDLRDDHTGSMRIARKALAELKEQEE